MINIKISLRYRLFPYPDREIPGNEPGNQLATNWQPSRLLSNDEIKHQVLGIFTDEIYRSLREA